MSKINSLILLVKSLSKSEKKAIYTRSQLNSAQKEYITLLKLIDKHNINDVDELSKRLTKEHPKAFFPATTSYLYNFILKTLVDIKQNQDATYNLYNNISAANILYERNLYSDYREMLEKLIIKAKEIENYNLLLILERMELSFFLKEGFNGISEKEILDKQHKINETIKVIRQINEQSTLYELLRFYLEYKPVTNNMSSRQLFNDLVVSEMSLVSNLKHDVFEINKLHQLFQAHYLISTGDYKSALNCFIELNSMFERNQKLWNNPPIYYMLVLEGVLESLRGIRKYDKIPYFLDKLKHLTGYSIYFQAEIQCIDFVYSIVPYTDIEDYKKGLDIIGEHRDFLFNKRGLLTPQRDLQLSLIIATVYLMTGNIHLAKKQLSHIICTDTYENIWLFRPIQLINLLIYYELNDFEFVTSSIRAIKRQNKIKNKKSNVEKILFQFLNTDLFLLSKTKKETLYKKFENELENMECIEDDNMLLLKFNFPKWILSHIN
ncbi:hypothetical protein [Prevotella sp. 10(H)]|uniref:hypothetical protein n=1 Tax=Prevotella sp. 10(H) TaxID=1158294 RepID=UPI0004A6D1D9|nr:hypothetical protein [Prevotella sp. 10(H)]